MNDNMLDSVRNEETNARFRNSLFEPKVLILINPRCHLFPPRIVLQRLIVQFHVEAPAKITFSLC